MGLEASEKIYGVEYVIVLHDVEYVVDVLELVVVDFVNVPGRNPNVVSDFEIFLWILWFVDSSGNQLPSH